MTARFRIPGLLQLSLIQQLRSGRWIAALVLFSAVFAGLAIWDRDSMGAFGQGVLLATAAGLSFGIAHDRKTGFDCYLSNFVAPGRVLVQKICATALAYAAFLLLVFAVAAVAWRRPEVAAWAACRSLLLLSLVFGLTLLIEIVLTTEYPAVVAILVGGATMIVGLQDDPERLIDFMGLDLTTGSYASFGRLLLVSAVLNALMAIVVCGVWILQHGRPRARASP